MSHGTASIAFIPGKDFFEFEVILRNYVIIIT